MKRRNIKCTLKKGRLSHEEKKNIEDWHSMMDLKELSERLNRSERQVKEFLDEYLANAPTLVAKRSETEEFKRELHASVFWRDLQEQFTVRQITYYENSYIEYRRQFKDMTPTEMKQLSQLITIDIYMNVHNVERRKTQEQIERLEKFISKEREKDINSLTVQEVSDLHMKDQFLLALKTSTEKKIGEFADLLKKHEDILKSLKSTRDQRMKNIDQEGKFMGILKELEIQSRRKDIGQIVGLVDLGIAKERARLATSIVYKDGEVDRPLLNSETVLFDEDE